MLKSVLLELYENEGLRFGKFLLKSGVIVPIYVDLRKIVSKPTLLVS